MIETLTGDGYEISVVVGDEPINPEQDALNVIVNLEGQGNYAAVFGTLQWVRERLDHYRQTGECASGLYFWTADLVIVEVLTLDVIRRAVEDMIETGTLQLAFSGPSFDITPSQETGQT